MSPNFFPSCSQHICIAANKLLIQTATARAVRPYNYLDNYKEINIVIIIDYNRIHKTKKILTGKKC